MPQCSVHSCSLSLDSEKPEPTLKRKKSKTTSVLKWDDSVSKDPEGNLTCPKPNCSYETYQKRYLEQHMKGHHDCPYCDKLFFRNNAKRSLVRHLKEHGVQTEDFKCQACQKTFKSKDGLPNLETPVLKPHVFIFQLTFVSAVKLGVLNLFFCYCFFDAQQQKMVFKPSI